MKADSKKYRLGHALFTVCLPETVVKYTQKPDIRCGKYNSPENLPYLAFASRIN